MCTTIEDIKEVDRLLVTITMKTRRELVRMSGCPEPCSYMEYGTSGDPIPTGSGHGIIITFNQKEMAVQSQVIKKKKLTEIPGGALPVPVLPCRVRWGPQPLHWLLLHAFPWHCQQYYYKNRGKAYSKQSIRDSIAWSLATKDMIAVINLIMNTFVIKQKGVVVSSLFLTIKTEAVKLVLLLKNSN